MTRILNIDFETRSEIDLTVVGAHLYAKHSSTRILCASYSFDAGKTVRRWRPWAGEKMPNDLVDALHDRDVEIQGWNAMEFERLILRDVAKIDIPPERFHDTMVRARSMALPGSLELCARALNMPIKKGDDAMMRRWMAPLKDGTWADDPAEFEVLCGYCDDDVRSEAGLAGVLRELTPDERQDNVVNAVINDRGITVDIELARAAQRYAKDELDDICDRLNVLTKSVVTSPKQHVRVKKWLAEELPPELQWFLDPDEVTGKVSFDASVREEILGADYEDILVGDIREFIELVHDGGKASVSKFATMQRRAGADQRVRGAYILNGAGQTGRFSSTGLQVHNYVRDTLVNIEDVVEAILKGVDRDQLIRTASFDPDGGLAFTDRKRKERIKKSHNVLTILSRCLRPSIIAPPGKVLVWRDWAQIEGRMCPWLSAENSASQKLELFATGADVYIHQAMMSFGVDSPEDVSTDQRQGGKVQELSFQFGGGAGAGMRMARKFGVDITERTADGWKVAWRQTNPWAPRFWGKLETAIFMAIKNPEQSYEAGRVSYLSAADVLWCLLPSGRLLSYPFPRVTKENGRWGTSAVVTAMKSSLHPKKGTNYWPRMKLWGGFAAENVTQGEAASLLRWARREVYANDWPQIGDSHDELLLEVDEDEETEAQAALKDIMENPPYATYAGLPLASEGGSGYAYGK